MNTGFPGSSVVKNPPALQEMCVRSLSWEDPLEKETTTHSSILAWESEVAQSRPTLSDPMDCSLAGSSAHGISQARILEYWTAALQASLFITNSWSLLKLMSIESGMPPNHLILCHALLLLPSIFPSIRVSSSQSDLCIR